MRQVPPPPVRVWGQDDFYGFAAYFARVGRKGTGLSPPISGGEEIVFTAEVGRGEAPADRRGAGAPAAVRHGRRRPTIRTRDPREALADWMTAPENPYFARVIVNRVWADLMGRGIVEPVDDLRATNPPSNGPLLDALADDFRRHGYDLKHLIRTIMTSYGLRPQLRARTSGTSPTRGTTRGTTASGCGPRCCSTRSADVTGVPETFEAAPPRVAGDGDLDPPVAVALPRHASAGPTRTRTRPASGRRDTSVVQALHLMNAPDLHRKVTSDDGRVAAPRPASNDRRARDRRGTLSARLRRLPDRGRAAGRRGAVRPSPGAAAARRSRTCCGP